MDTVHKKTSWPSSEFILVAGKSRTLRKAALPIALLAMASGCGESFSSTQAVTDCPTVSTYSPPPPATSAALTGFSLDDPQSTNAEDGSGSNDESGSGSNAAGGDDDKSPNPLWEFLTSSDECNEQCQLGRTGGHGQTHADPNRAETLQSQQETRRDAMASTQNTANDHSPCPPPSQFNGGAPLNANVQNGQQVQRSPITDSSNGGRATPHPAAGFTPDQIGDAVQTRAENSLTDRVDAATKIMDSLRGSTPTPEPSTEATDSTTNCGLSASSGSQINGTGVTCDTNDGRGNTLMIPMD